MSADRWVKEGGWWASESLRRRKFADVSIWGPVSHYHHQQGPLDGPPENLQNGTLGDHRISHEAPPIGEPTGRGYRETLHVESLGGHPV